MKRYKVIKIKPQNKLDGEERLSFHVARGIGEEGYWGGHSKGIGMILGWQCQRSI